MAGSRHAALPTQPSRQSIPPTTNKAHRGTCLIDRAFDWIARVIELVLAFAFILAVLLNFTNVVGRYLFGISLLGSDELQVFIIVGVTFLGAAVVTRRNQHLRMDVLVQFMPAWLRLALRVIEQLLLIALAGFVISQSFFYARQMLRIGRTSDMAGVPMWIPHGTVALGFTLILIVVLWRLIGIVRRSPQEAASDKAAP
jgi:TRAP-type C4-dicarboxylate transport system permease small subunit